MADLYTIDILRLSAGLAEAVRLENPTHTVTKKSRICGSSIVVDVVIEAGEITQYGQGVKACALGQASAAIVQKYAVGLDAEALERVAAAFEAMINGNAFDKAALWPELRHLEVVKDNPSRKGSVMLPFDALREVLKG